jgi:hypothetical protein
MLADRNAVVGEYGGPLEVISYPLAFHPAHGNFSSPRPPAFLDHVLAIIRDNMSFQNDGTDILKCGYCQAYSNTKRSIRHAPGDLLVTKSIATAALILPEMQQLLASENQMGYLRCWSREKAKGVPSRTSIWPVVTPSLRYSMNGVTA